MVAASLLLGACAEPVPPDYADYIGHWRGDGVRLVITADGHGDFERVRGQQRLTVIGPVHAFDAHGFTIGRPGFSTRFSVTRPPELRDGRWRMAVDDIELSRVEILPTPNREPR